MCWFVSDARYNAKFLNVVTWITLIMEIDHREGDALDDTDRLVEDIKKRINEVFSDIAPVKDIKPDGEIGIMTPEEIKIVEYDEKLAEIRRQIAFVDAKVEAKRRSLEQAKRCARKSKND